MTVLQAADGAPRPPLAPVLLLAAALAVVGAAALVWPRATWAALALYGSGSLGLLLREGLGPRGWRAVLLAGSGWRASVAWGLGLGAALATVALVGMGPMAAAGAAGDGVAPMAGMADLLLGHRLVLLLPLLVLAEEGLWRGLLLPALLGRGLGAAAAVALSTAAYALVHLAVAPVPWGERWAMAAMAVPLGLLNGALTLATGSLWGAVVLHLVVMGSMVAMLR